MSDVYLVTKRMPHHGDFSGYHQIARFFAPPHRVRSNRVARSIAGHWWNWHAQNLPHPRHYSHADYAFEFELLATFWRRRKMLTHFLYGEDQLWVSAKAPRPKGCILLATYHQPPSELPRFLPDPGFVSGLDGVILVSAAQVPFFSRFLPADRIHVVPHGVDTAHFAPSSSARDDRDNLNVLCVGNWLRDFTTLDAIATTLTRNKALGRRVRLTFVGHTDPGVGARDGLNYEVRLGVDDAVLLDLYRQNDVLLLPLHDSTANNALLEGMACGLAPVVSDVGGVRDYVGHRSAVLTAPGDAAAMVDALATFLNDRVALRRMQYAAREQVLPHAWPVVAAKLAAVYRLYGAAETTPSAA